MTKEFSASTISDLKPVCAFLKTLATDKKIVLFSGEMGAGKTTLIKELCAHLGIEDQVSSPTFSLVNEYESPIGPVYHFDLYRIKSEEELYDIGYEDYFFSGYLCLVEWPEMAVSLIPNKHISVAIKAWNNRRKITITE